MLRLFAKLAADRNAVLTGQHQVQDNEIETFVDREFEAVRAAVGEIEFVPLGLEILTYVRRDIRIVFDNQNFHNASGYPRRCKLDVNKVSAADLTQEIAEQFPRLFIGILAITR